MTARGGRGAVVWLWLSGLVLAADQLTKALAERWLALHQPVPVMPSFNFMLTYNRGAAFSFLGDASGWQRWFFVALALTVTVVLVVWLLRLPRAERWTAVSLALVLGGALGNLVDRLVRGAVADFIDLYYGTWHWPAFNVADIAICVGAGMLILDTMRTGSRAGENT